MQKRGVLLAGFVFVVFSMLAAYPVFSTGSPPTHSKPYISSSSGLNYSIDNITCQNQSTSDPESDVVTNIYNWYKDGESIMVLNIPFDTNFTATDNSTAGVTDYSSFGNDGRLGNSSAGTQPTWNSSGMVGGSYDFDGVDDYIDFGNKDSLNFTSSDVATISAWFKVASFNTTNQMILARTTPYRTDYSIGVNDSNTVCYSYDAFAWNEFTTWDVLEMNTGEWHHIAMVLNNDATVTVYFDGALISTKPAPHDDYGGNDVYIGIGDIFNDVGSSTLANDFNGTIDEVRIYNVSLSAEQIYQLYTDAKDGYSDNATVVSSEISDGETWTCEVTPNDGTSDGSSLNSSDLVIASTLISGCSTLNSAGTYVLTQDITDNSSSCFQITASSVTIDCNGYKIDGTDAASTYGIYTNGYNSVTVKNCLITDWDHGIYLQSTTTNSILDTNLSSNEGRGIYFTSVDSSTIEDVIVSGNLGHGIYFDSSTGNTLNRVNASHGSNYGISFDSSSNNNVINNSIASNNNVNGIGLGSASGNRIINTDIFLNDIHGVLMNYATNSNLTGCNIYSNVNQGIRLTYSGNNWIKDTIISNSGSYDVYADDSSTSNAYFVNSTFNKSDVSVNNNAIVWVRWYMDSRILDTGDNPISNATMNITDINGNLEFDGETNSSGYIQRLVLSEYNQTSSGKNYYTEYTVISNKTGYTSNSTSVNLTYSMLVTVYIEGMVPSVTVKTYTSGLTETSTFPPGRIIRIRATGTHGLDRIYLDNSTVTITNPSDTDVVSNALMFNISEITNGYIYEYNYTLPQTATGIWTISVTLSDTLSDQDYDSTKISVGSMTLQIKLILNNTGAKIYVPSTGVGEQTFSSLTPDTYSTPSHYYLASYLNNALSSMVLYSGSPISSFTEKHTSGNTYTLGIDERFSNSGVFLVFTEGDWRTTDRRMSLIEKEEFLSEISPSFARGLGNSYPLKIVLDYDNIDINSSSLVGRGYSRVVIENTGRSGSKTSMEIKRA